MTTHLERWANASPHLAAEMTSGELAEVVGEIAAAELAERYPATSQYAATVLLLEAVMRLADPGGRDGINAALDRCGAKAQLADRRERLQR